MFQKLKKLPLHSKIIIGLILGVAFALTASSCGWSKFTIDWIYPFGVIFINLLKMIAVPLVLFSIISGVSSFTDVSKIGRLGGKTLGLYLITTVVAVSLGLALVNSIAPGKRINETQRVQNHELYTNWLAESNGVAIGDDAALADKMALAEKTKGQGPLQFLVDMVPSNVFSSFTDNGSMLKIIFFAIFFGLCMLFLPNETVAPISAFVNSANEIFLKMVDIIMRGSPFFVFALLAGVVCSMAHDSPAQVIEIFKGLGWYSITVVIGLAFMVFVFYPILVNLTTKGKMNYGRFLRGISPAQMLAFSTSSSAATLPVTIECVTDNLKVSKSVSSFVLPIGATVNMDGTSLYQAVAVVFLAQFHMIDLSIGMQLTIILTATLASIGSAAVPSAGLIMLIIVLESVGLNPAWIAIIFPVDRILDMCRTVVNVTGDAAVSTIIAVSENELEA